MNSRAGLVAAMAFVVLVSSSVARTAEAPNPPGFCDGSAIATVGEGSLGQVPVHSDIFGPAYAAACPSAGGSVNYLGTGDAQGVKVMMDRLLPSAFGTSDVALSPSEKAITEADGDKLLFRYSPVLQIPLYVDALAVGYNIPCAVPPVKFRSSVLSLIFSGSVTRWNDPSLVADNPSLASCNEPMRLVKRADAAGATAVFKDYLAKRNPQWQVFKQPALNRQWPTLNFACSGGGDEGMASCIRSFRGSIGYVQLAVARASGLTVGEVENLSQAFVAASPSTCSTAAASAVIPPGVPSVALPGYSTKRIPATMGDWSTVSITDAPNGSNAASYPICNFSFLFVFYATGNAYGFTLPGRAVRNVIDYFWVALRGGTQAQLSQFGYAPLPPNVLDVAREGVLSIRTVFDIP